MLKQANDKSTTGCVRLDINFLKPSRLEFAQAPAPVVTLPERAAETPQWLEYVYRTAHPALRWLPTKLAEWIGENLQDEMGFPDKADKSLLRGPRQAQAGLLLSSIISCKPMLWMAP